MKKTLLKGVGTLSLLGAMIMPAAYVGATSTIDPVCVNAQVAIRDTAEGTALATFAAAIQSALTIRTTAVQAGWTLQATDMQAGKDARKAAWTAFSSARQAARTAYNDAVTAARTNFKTVVHNTCHVPMNVTAN